MQWVGCVYVRDNTAIFKFEYSFLQINNHMVSNWAINN